MDINFHYAAIKVIANHAGFKPAESELIAYASQFVDDANEYIPATHWPVGLATGCFWGGDALLYALMRSRRVEELHILMRHPPEMRLIDDQHLVQILFSHGPNPALCIRVCIWGAIWCGNHIDTR